MVNMSQIRKMHLSGSASWRRFAAVFLLALVAGDFLGHAARAASVNSAHTSSTSPLDKIENVIVIYLENWSFDGLFGKFPGCNNLDTADAKTKMIQRDKEGQPYVNLPADPQNIMGNTTLYPNGMWDIEPLVKARPDDVRWLSITHRFFHEKYQINNGKMDKFVAWSSAAGLAMSYFDVTNQYFGQLAKNYTLLDNFFHSAFGGSFLNHQWLVAAQTPTYPSEFILPEWRSDLIATFDANNFIVHDGPVTPEYFAVNHMESRNPPLNNRTFPSHRVPSQNHTTVGDLLSNAGVSWRWYSGGYNDALQGKGEFFQYHHQPFVFFERFKDPESWDRREHLKDEVDLLRDLETGNLPKVSFYKPYGEDNFHPGSSTVAEGQKKLQQIVEAIQNSRYWEKCAIVITFDENGGRFDHVTPPIGDYWGPGSRIPAVIVSPHVRKGYVDSSVLETISITRFIEELGGVNGTVIPRTRSVTSLAKVFLDAAGSLDGSPSQPAKHDDGLPVSLIVLAGVVVAMLCLVIGFVIFLLVRSKNQDHSLQEPLAKGHKTYLNRATSYGQVDEEVLE